MKLRLIVFTAAALMTAQSAQAQSAAAVAVLKDGLNSICKPWLDGEVRAAMATRLTNAGWGNTLNVIFFKDGPWGRVQAAAQQPDTGRTCTASLSVKETPWSNKAARAAADAWAASNIGGNTAARPLELDGQAVDAAMWQNDSGRTLTINQYRTKQEHNDIEVVVSQPKP